MDLITKTAQHIVALRQRGWFQGQIADACGVSGCHISAVKLNRKPGSRSLRRKIEELYNAQRTPKQHQVFAESTSAMLINKNAIPSLSDISGASYKKNKETTNMDAIKELKKQMSQFKKELKALKPKETSWNILKLFRR